jgi:hypothetical protein
MKDIKWNKTNFKNPIAIACGTTETEDSKGLLYKCKLPPAVKKTFWQKIWEKLFKKSSFDYNEFLTINPKLQEMTLFDTEPNFKDKDYWKDYWGSKPKSPINTRPEPNICDTGGIQKK